jgi:hypothetical protein
MSILNQGYQQGLSGLTGSNHDPFGLELIRAMNRIEFTINRLAIAVENYMAQAKGKQLNLRQIDDNDDYDNPTFRGGASTHASSGHQAPGSKEVELPNDDGYAAKLPKR